MDQYDIYYWYISLARDMMKDTAKLFMNGRSQAVRLPAKYRFDCDEVYIRKDHETGEVIISERAKNWDEFFQLLDSVKPEDDLSIERDFENIEEKDLF